MSNVGDAYPHRTGSGEIFEDEVPVSVTRSIGNAATRSAGVVEVEAVPTTHYDDRQTVGNQLPGSD